MKELELKYGCNPNQKPSRIYVADGSELPIEVLSGKPGYINLLDAFNGWQLVTELKKATGLPAATSFKHVSPAGAAVGLPMTDVLKKIYWVDDMGELITAGMCLCESKRALTECPPTEILSLCPMCVIKTRQCLLGERFPTVLSRLDIPMRHWRSLKQKKERQLPCDEDRSVLRARTDGAKEVFGITFEQGRQELP